MNPFASAEFLNTTPFSPTVALMRASPACAPAYTAAITAAEDVPPKPFSKVFVTIINQEHIELKLTATRFQGLHRKALDTQVQKFLWTRVKLLISLGVNPKSWQIWESRGELGQTGTGTGTGRRKR